MTVGQKEGYLGPEMELMGVEGRYLFKKINFKSSDHCAHQFSMSGLGNVKACEADKPQCLPIQQEMHKFVVTRSTIKQLERARAKY